MYKQNLQSFFDKLGNAKKMVLATSKDNHVSARMMSCIILEKTIYFQTDKKSLKFEQIKSNPYVALCDDNIQIEGIATEIGHPLDKENIFFANEYKKYYAHSFELYTSLPSEVLCEVKLKKIALWEYHKGKPMISFFDLEKQQYSFEPYFIEQK